MITVLSNECISVQSHNPQPPPSNQKQAERARRPRPPAAPTEHRTQEAHRRDNHASTQKTAEEAPGKSPHKHGAKAPREPGAMTHRPRQAPAAQTWAAHRTRAPGARAPPNPPAEAPPNTREGQAPQTATQWASACPSAPGQVPWESRCAHRRVKPRAAGRGNAAPPSGAAQAGQRTASPRPRPSHYHTHFHIPYIHTCPPSLNPAGVWRSGHTPGDQPPPSHHRPRTILLAPPAPCSNQETGVWEDPSPHPSGFSILSNSERLKLRGSQPCRTGSAALWAAYIPKEPRPPDATQCNHPPRPNVCVCVSVCLIGSNV